MAVYFLIMIGSVVRTTGSGMGCHDWPRCFAKWSPPSSVSQLPENYKEVYAASREKKNVKFARYLRVFGLDETADKLQADSAVSKETDFNVTKAWIEYANRIVGVIIGFFIIALFYRSLQFRKTRPALFYLALLTLVGVIFQGWFGSIVVSTNLTTWTITVHMFLALVIVVLLVKMYTITFEKTDTPPQPQGVRALLIACMATLLLQVFFGTEVRAVIDRVSGELPRGEWLEAAGGTFVLHRSFSLVVLLLHVILITKLLKTMQAKTLTRALIILILGTLLSGVGMGWFNVPALLQPLHLTLATGTFGLQIFMFFEWTKRRQTVATN